MSIIQAARVSRAPIAGLAAVGVFWGGFAALVPEIKAQAGASDAEFGTALIMSAVGGMLSMYLSPRVAVALGRRILPLSGAALFLALFLPIMADSVPSLGLALFGMGAAVSMLDISANVRISQLEERHRLHLMNLNHAMFSFGFAGSAFATSIARKAGFGAAEILPFVALACLALAGAMVEGRGWLAAEQKGDGGDGRSPWGVILPAAAILFAAFICENATEAWSALHIERTLGGAAGEGGFGPMMLGLTMGFGRLSGQFAAARLGEAGLILWSAALGVVGAIVIGLAPVQAVAVLGVGLLGLGVAVVVPSANSILGRLVHPDLRGFAISRAWMIGFTGFFIGPTAMGLIAEFAGLRVAFLVIACVMATLIPWTRMLQRRGG
ncbi:MFS transporter [Ostreiculturibacter nitratireducens]|uniref:MFS transporter n=1 Tax=Ostreiculturibacter nitratireducens TaxID=3075226 RepID=UPI0031B5650B